MTDILLTKSELDHISKNIRVTKHAIERLTEFAGTSSISFIRNKIADSPLAWRQDNGQIVVTVDEFSCFILYKYFSYYVLVSYLRKSENNYSVVDKFILEYKGVKKNWDHKNK